MRESGALLAAITVLTSCAHYRPKPLTPAGAMNTLESRSLADSGLRAFLSTNSPPLAKEWPRSSWDLSALALAAFYYHPEMEMAQANLAAAEAAVITAGARPNPTFSC